MNFLRSSLPSLTPVALSIVALVAGGCSSTTAEDADQNDSALSGTPTEALAGVPKLELKAFSAAYAKASVSQLQAVPWMKLPGQAARSVNDLLLPMSACKTIVKTWQLTDSASKQYWLIEANAPLFDVTPIVTILAFDIEGKPLYRGKRNPTAEGGVSWELFSNEPVWPLYCGVPKP